MDLRGLLRSIRNQLADHHNGAYADQADPAQGPRRPRGERGHHFPVRQTSSARRHRRPRSRFRPTGGRCQVCGLRGTGGRVQALSAAHVLVPYNGRGTSERRLERCAGTLSGRKAEPRCEWARNDTGDVHRQADRQISERRGTVRRRHATTLRNLTGTRPEHAVTRARNRGDLEPSRSGELWAVGWTGPQPF